MKAKTLEDRLIDFSVMIIHLEASIPATRAGNNLSNQIVRSGTSPALNYGEAQSAESRKDFIHKMNICLKELRETNVCLQILKRASLYKNTADIEATVAECNELISIFVKSILTAKKNAVRKGKHTI